MTSRGIGATNVAFARARDLKNGMLPHGRAAARSDRSQRHECRDGGELRVDCVLRMMLALEDEFGIELGETRMIEMTGYATIRAVVGDLRAANS